MKKDYVTCLVECRKAIYLEFESSFDISPFLEEDYDPSGGLPYGFEYHWCKSPLYARRKKYIEENVHEPTDFIVLDREELERKLTRAGLDAIVFENIRRQTPPVYRPHNKKDVPWAVREEFSLLDEEGIEHRAEYVFENTVEIFLAVTARRRRARGRPQGQFFIELKREGVPYYQKADKTSAVAGNTPSGLTRLDCTRRINGLKGDGIYFHVSHNPSETDWDIDTYIWGYIHEDDVQ